MATPERNHGKIATIVKKAATILTTTGFFAAAIVLAAVLWMPANAAPASSAVDVQPSLLLAFDTPKAPAPKLHSRDLPSLADADVDVANIARPDVATELNDWTYTQGNILQDLFGIVVAEYLYQAYAASGNFNAAAYWKTTATLDTLYLFQAFGFSSPILTTLINNLTVIQNNLSPYR